MWQVCSKSKNTSSIIPDSVQLFRYWTYFLSTPLLTQKYGYFLLKSIINLDLAFDNNLTFEEHNNSKIQKTYGVLNRIRHTKYTIPNYVKGDIVTALIDPIMNYCS